VRRCEAEESESADVKIEDSAYHPTNGSNWQPDRNGITTHGRPYDTLPLAPVSNTVLKSSFYSGTGAAPDRWSEPYDTSHSPPRSETRGQIPWSISPTQLQHNGFTSGRRGEDSGHPDSSWHSSSPPSHPANWHAEPYGLSAVTSDLFVDQSRTPRNSSNQYHNPSLVPHSRSTDDSPYSSPGQGGHGIISNHDVGSHQRLSWMLPTETAECERGSRTASRTPFTSDTNGSLSQHFTATNSYSLPHSFSAAWPSSAASPIDSPSSPVFSHRTHMTYDNSYSGSRADEDYVAVEDYGEF
jgi:hypothetical protein